MSDKPISSESDNVVVSKYTKEQNAESRDRNIGRQTPNPTVTLRLVGIACGGIAIIAGIAVGNVPDDPSLPDLSNHLVWSIALPYIIGGIVSIAVFCGLGEVIKYLDWIEENTRK